MKKLKLAVNVLVALAVLALSFFAGARYASHLIRRETLLANLDMDVYMYHCAEGGETARVKRLLSYNIYNQCQAYTTWFGNEPFARVNEPSRMTDFEEASRIAKIAATNGDLNVFMK